MGRRALHSVQNATSSPGRVRRVEFFQISSKYQVANEDSEQKSNAMLLKSMMFVCFFWKIESTVFGINSLTHTER